MTDFSDAPCRGKTHAFFPLTVSTHRHRALTTTDWRRLCAPALALCETCPPPTRRACRDEAIRLRDYDAPRGGLTPPELRQAAQQRRTG